MKKIFLNFWRRNWAIHEEKSSKQPINFGFEIEKWSMGDLLNLFTVTFPSLHYMLVTLLYRSAADTKIEQKYLNDRMFCSLWESFLEKQTHGMHCGGERHLTLACVRLPLNCYDLLHLPRLYAPKRVLLFSAAYTFEHDQSTKVFFCS